MLTFEVNPHGAELRSLRLDGREYLWQGDPAFWGRRAPILFPVVGTVSGRVLRIGGKLCPQGRHGFARDVDFVPDGPGSYKFVQAGENPAYPYQFSLRADYLAQGNSLSCQWKVTNIGPSLMHFQIGAHPAFFLPDYNADDPVHGYFRCFGPDGSPVSPLSTNYCHHDGLRRAYEQPQRFFDAQGIMPITGSSFDNDAILIEGCQVTGVLLLDKQMRPVLRVDCPNAQAYGLWAPDKSGCPFVCIEPWCGITDSLGFQGEIGERELDHCIGPQESFNFDYSITLF